MTLEFPYAQVRSLAVRGAGIVGEVDQLDEKLSIYKPTKLLVDDETFDIVDSFEQEGRRTRLSYHAFYESTHKRWVEWANDAEGAMVEAKGARSKLGRFRLLRDQVNKLYSRREIDLTSISAKIKEQTAIVERLPQLGLAKEAHGTKPRRSQIRGRSSRGRFDLLVGKIEKNPYYKTVIIIGGVLGFILVLLRLATLI
jgi:hypothetical protein